MASRIHFLSDGCINQIAAGEVIERPCSVVKELLENATDAQATRIDVAVEAGGVPFIRVRDNGLGMTAEELAQAVLPHATSKITSFEDLLALETMGFRGEALPSIASVAELEIISRPSESTAGSIYRWEGGLRVEQNTCASPLGTTVTVRRLFENVPARLKFLKSTGTEFGLISDMIGKMAMTRPDIGFSLAHPQRVVFQTSGNGELRDVLGQVLSRELAKNLIPIGGIYKGLSVGGFISPPHMARSSKNTQTFIVNRRVVRAKVLTQALREGYHTYMPAGSHPVAVLVLNLDPGLVDVNVHPAKTEIKFHGERLILERVRETLQQALRSTPVTKEIFALPLQVRQKYGTSSAREIRVAERPQGYQGKASTSQTTASIDGETALLDGQKQSNRQTQSNRHDYSDQPEYVESPLMNPVNDEELGISGELPASDRLAQKIDNIVNRKSLAIHFGEGISIGQFLEEDTPDEPNRLDRSNPDNGAFESSLFPERGSEPELFLPINENEAFFQSLRPLAQLFETYILAEGRDTFYMIDQHAAHERIRYEEFIEQANRSEAASQVLLTPLVVHLTLREEQAMLEYLPQLREMGFLIEDFGIRTYLLRGVPVGTGQMDAEEYFHRFLDGVLTTVSVPSMPQLLEKWIFMLACHNSVKASDHLSLAEMSELLRRLGRVSNPFSCPHGRPLLVSFSRQDLEKRFGRT